MFRCCFLPNCRYSTINVIISLLTCKILFHFRNQSLWHLVFIFEFLIWNCNNVRCFGWQHTVCHLFDMRGAFIQWAWVYILHNFIFSYIPLSKRLGRQKYIIRGCWERRNRISMENRKKTSKHFVNKPWPVFSKLTIIYIMTKWTHGLCFRLEDQKSNLNDNSFRIFLWTLSSRTEILKSTPLNPLSWAVSMGCGVNI